MDAVDDNTTDGFLSSMLSCHLQKSEYCFFYYFSAQQGSSISVQIPLPAVCVFCVCCSSTGSCCCCLPDLWVAVTKDLRQQLRRLLKTATQLVQLLLHGEDTLLQLPIRVIPVSAEVTHDHLHLLKPSIQLKFKDLYNFQWKKTHRGLTVNLNSVQTCFNAQQ